MHAHYFRYGFSGPESGRSEAFTHPTAKLSRTQDGWKSSQFSIFADIGRGAIDREGAGTYRATAVAGAAHEVIE